MEHIHSSKLERSSSDANSKDCVNLSLQRVTGGLDEEEEYRPFPTLIEALSNVSDNVGFNIEIKYPQMLIVRPYLYMH